MKRIVQTVFASAPLRVFCATALLLSGCAYVEQVDRSGVTRRTITLVSPINFIRTDDSESRVVRMTGIGAGLGAGTWSVGYYRTSLIELDPACRVVVIGSTKYELQNLRNLSGDPGRICDDQSTKGDNDAH